MTGGIALFNSNVRHNAYAFTAYFNTIFLILSLNSSIFHGSSDTLHINWLIDWALSGLKYMYLAWDFEAQTESSKVPASWDRSSGMTQLSGLVVNHMITKAWFDSREGGKLYKYKNIFIRRLFVIPDLLFQGTKQQNLISANLTRQLIPTSSGQMVGLCTHELSLCCLCVYLSVELYRSCNRDFYYLLFILGFYLRVLLELEYVNILWCLLQQHQWWLWWLTLVLVR